jgi:hypothetical protein
MGSTATLIGAIALATGLACLFFGYLWGRSNVKSRVEDALDQARISADAREFALRQQLDEKMVENAEFRARTEQRPRLQEQLEQVKLEQMHGSASGGAAAEELGNAARATPELSGQKQEATPAIDSTEKTIQNFLKSIEEKLKQPGEPPIVTQNSTKPVPPRLPEEEPPAVTQQSPRPAPPELPSVEPLPTPKDEWQEFAASLAALTRRRK